MLNLKNTMLGLFLVLAHMVSAQSPYDLKPTREILFLGTSAVVGATGLWLNGQLAPLTANEIENLSPASIPKFDRGAVENYSPRADKASDVLQVVGYTLPAVFLIDRQTRRDFGKLSLMMFQGLALTTTSTTLTKVITKRSRPYVYNPDVPLDVKTTKQARKAFFSGHTSVNTFMFFFTAKVLNDYSHNKWLKAAIWTIGAGTPAVMGYLRVRAGQHFISDVMVGYAFGAAIGILTPHLHRVTHSNRVSIEPRLGPGHSGLSFSYRLYQ